MDSTQPEKKKRNRSTKMTQYRFDREERKRLKIKEQFVSGKTDFDTAVAALRKLGFSENRAPQVVRQWKDERNNAE
jgi:Holliday junction resolvasome RuvABC DNA-binding subunit